LASVPTFSVFLLVGFERGEDMKKFLRGFGNFLIMGGWLVVVAGVLVVVVLVGSK
jgi:hypothetical protein